MKINLLIINESDEKLYENSIILQQVYKLITNMKAITWYVAEVNKLHIENTEAISFPKFPMTESNFKLQTEQKKM